ncbi:MAG: hypothetical protein R8M11_04845 [Gallionella sp.]
MQELLNHPAVQAGFAPFLVALITALLLQRFRLSGFSIIVGFAITIYLVSNFSFDPLTSTRKIVLSGLLAAAIALPFSLLPSRWVSYLLAILGGATAVWAAYGILKHQETQTFALWAAGCAAYAAVLVWGMDRLAHQPVRAAGAATALGIGTGASALIGASALLGQFGLAIGSAAIAHLLIIFITNRPLPVGRTFTLPLAIIAALTGSLAVLSASLPWYALLSLALIPTTALLMPLPGNSLRIQSVLLTVVTFVLAGISIYLAWQSAGDVLY